MNDKFCSYPFHSVVIENGVSSPVMRPCCRYQIKTKADSAAEYFNSDEMKDLRRYFLEDPTKLPAGCSVCEQHEQKGLQSFRQNTQDYFSHNTDVVEPKLRYYSINIGWACNMSCYMCDPGVSSGVAEEHKTMGLIKKIPKLKNTSNFLATISDIDSDTELNFINGEFFIDANADRLLDIAIERGCRLSFTTNCSQVTEAQLEKLQRLKDKSIGVSIDGVGQLYDIMRYPSNWDNFNANLIKLRPSVFSLRMVAQNLNVFGMLDVMQFGYKNKLNTEINLVQDKSWLLFDSLDDADRANLLTLLYKQLADNKHKLTRYHIGIFEGYITEIENTRYNSYHDDMLVRRLSATWQHRQQDFSMYKDIYPSFYEKICNKINNSVQ